MDDIDRRILALLVDDARTSYADLAREVGLSAPSVHERVRRLERDGVLLGSHADVDMRSVGLGVSALVGLQQGEGVESGALADALEQVPEVEDCWFVAGDEAFLVKVRVPDVDALEQVLGALRRVPGVSRTRTTVVLSTRFEGRRRVPVPVAQEPS